MDLCGAGLGPKHFPAVLLAARRAYQDRDYPAVFAIREQDKIGDPGSIEARPVHDQKNEEEACRCDCLEKAFDEPL